MKTSTAHLSDEELLLFSDQELSVRPAAKMREHIAQCERCRGRLKELETASAEFADLHEVQIQEQKSISPNSRHLLRARLSGADGPVGKSPWSIFGRPGAQQLIAACVVVLLIFGNIWTVRHNLRARINFSAMQADALALPRRTLTPGAVRPVKVADLCGGHNLVNDPPVNSSLEQAVFQEYGVPASSKTDYELDYLITPSLGGAGNLQNLWPQSYTSTWNAHVKDQLEDHLHELVCDGQVQLATAQNDIASDWIAAYKRYFNTDKPEPNLARGFATVRRGHRMNPSQPEHLDSRISVMFDLGLGVEVWERP
jgi:hypothetical protein